jgi:hypothetical protein
MPTYMPRTKKFIAADDVRHKARFKEAISEGGDAWAKYLKLINSGAHGKIVTLSQKRSR